jgi:hypothetical protein
MVVVTQYATERENPERTVEGKFLERHHEPLGHLSDKLFYFRVYAASRNTNTVSGMREREAIRGWSWVKPSGGVWSGIQGLLYRASRKLCRDASGVSKDQIKVAEADDHEHCWESILAVSSPADPVTLLLGNGDSHDVG